MIEYIKSNRHMRARDWLFDAAIAVAAFILGWLQLILTSSILVIANEGFRQTLGVLNVNPPLAVYLALALISLPLVARRKFPWPVLIVCLTSYLIFQNMFPGFSFAVIAPAVALFTVAFERTRNELLIAGVLSVLVIAVVAAPASVPSLTLFLRIQNTMYLAIAVFAGYALKMHQGYIVEAEQRALEAEKATEKEAARRVEEERVHIAREIHDITAHSLSAISIQAAAAEQLIGTDTKVAEQAIKTVRATAKNALDEIRAMIGVLRQEEETQTEPTSGTERMGEIIASLRDAGIEVEFKRDEYESDRVPSYIDIALFGIAREAITNIIKHSKATKAQIVLRTGPTEAFLSIEDNGIGSASEPQQRGHGIQGMYERVAVLGGVLMIETKNPVGFSVQAEIPLNSREESHG